MLCAGCLLHLGKIDVRLMGATGWYFANRELDRLAEAPHIGCSLSWGLPESVQESVTMVKTFIGSGLPKYIEFIAILLDVPWEQYPH